jgi:hypothetical protein
MAALSSHRRFALAGKTHKPSKSSMPDGEVLLEMRLCTYAEAEHVSHLLPAKKHLADRNMHICLLPASTLVQQCEYASW